MSILKKLITYVRKAGYRTAKIFGYKPREKPPVLYIEKIAKRKKVRKAFAAEAMEDARRAALTAIKTEARAWVAMKRFGVKEERKTYAYLTSHRARLERRRIRKAHLGAMERAAFAKRTLKKRISDYSKFLKKGAFKRKEFEKRFEKAAREIRYRQETAFSWQVVFSASFMCPGRKKPTKILEGYSSIRFTRIRRPCQAEVDEMTEEAIRYIQGQYLDANSECYPIEGTISTELRRRDLVKEAEGMRKARLDKEAATEVLRAKMIRQKQTKKKRRKR